MDPWESALCMLTVFKIHDAIPKSWFSRAAERSKDALVRESSQFTGELQEVLGAAVAAKQVLMLRKRNRDAEPSVEKRLSELDIFTALNDEELIDESVDAPTATQIESSDPDVIPLQALGCCDTDLTNMSTSELRLYVLANIEKEGDEGGYAMHMEEILLQQYSHACGHMVLAVLSWIALTKSAFLNTSSGACNPMIITLPPTTVSLMQRWNFEADAHILSTITPANIYKAQLEEDSHQPISDPWLQLLKKHIFVTYRQQNNGF
ncbi:hypothetical protein JB92DRAFT_3103553 [Gautieria morchelliformis]|nr:hypothetical protein JB92DRAFT_3103553 [Gautieria morchelliformis]